MSVFELLEIILLPLLLVVMLALPVYAVIKKHKTGNSMRWAMIANLCSFALVMVAAIALPMFGMTAGAEEAKEVATAASSAGLGYLAAALAVGIGSIGCGIAVGNAAPAAIGAIAEEPKAFAKALIFVALGEGVAIYGLLIAIMILSKLG